MIVDIFLVIFLVGNFFVGLKKGMIKLLTSLVGFVLAIIIAYIFSSTLSNILYKEAGFGPVIKNVVYENIIKYTNASKTVNEADKYIQNINYLMTTEEKSLIDNLDENVKGSETTVKAISERITRFILKGLSFIMIMIAVSIIVSIFGKFLDGIFSFPILNILNKLGGGGLASLIAIIKILMVLAVISYISPFGFINFITRIIDNTTIIKYMYYNNLFVTLIINRYLN